MCFGIFFSKIYYILRFSRTRFCHVFRNHFSSNIEVPTNWLLLPQGFIFNDIFLTVFLDNKFSITPVAKNSAVCKNQAFFLALAAAGAKCASTEILESSRPHNISLLERHTPSASASDPRSRPHLILFRQGQQRFCVLH